MSKDLYTKDSIEHLEPREFVRHAPHMYIGDTTYSTQLLVEVLANSVDEARLSHGNLIKVKIDKDIVTIEDEGQGILVNEPSKDDPSKTILEGVFSVFNTSGKYNSESGVYQGTSLGSYGIGSKLATFLSSQLQVTSIRDGKSETLLFKDGILNKRTIEEKEGHGLIVKWQPDPQFFEHTEVDLNEVKKLVKTLVCLCPELRIELTVGGETTEYKSRNGIQDLIDEVVGRAPKDKIGTHEIINNRLSINWKKEKYGLDLVMTYSDLYSSSLVCYVNTGNTSSGSHITGLKTAITREMNKFFKNKGWLKDKDNNLTGDDIGEGLVLICNITSPDVKYNQQIKTQVVSMTTKPIIDAFVEELNRWLERNEKEIKKVFDKAALARKAREAAKKARDTARNIGSSKNKKKMNLNLPSKLVDCWGKNRLDCELLISEGDSAASGLIEGRDSEIHAIFPVRGKIISFWKNSSEKVFANQEVLNLIKAIGLELNPQTQKLIYDVNKLRYGKIFLCADAELKSAV